jgi:hypothetical protein
VVVEGFDYDTQKLAGVGDGVGWGDVAVDGEVRGGDERARWVWNDFLHGLILIH